MKPKGIIFKGLNKGLNIIIEVEAFKDENQMLHMVKGKLRNSKGPKNFYRGSTLYVTTDLDKISKRAVNEIKAFLYNELGVKECIFKEIKPAVKKKTNNAKEGKTKFIRKSIRSGQVVSYDGSVVIIGDVNPGAEVIALGNVVVMGNIRGSIHAGADGNHSAIVAAMNMQPTLVRIGKYATLFSDDEKPKIPEVIRVNNNKLVIEPYIPNKIY